MSLLHFLDLVVLEGDSCCHLLKSFLQLFIFLLERCDFLNQPHFVPLINLFLRLFFKGGDLVLSWGGLLGLCLILGLFILFIELDPLSPAFKSLLSFNFSHLPIFPDEDFDRFL